MQYFDFAVLNDFSSFSKDRLFEMVAGQPGKRSSSTQQCRPPDIPK